MAKLERWKVDTVLETLLLVEGEPTARNLMKFMLEVNGYRVVEAADGVEALQILDQYGGNIHVALCAGDLPDMSGPEWRSQARFLAPGLPVLVFADRDCAELAAPAFAAPVSDARKVGGKFLERIRLSLDESFFVRCGRAPAA